MWARIINTLIGFWLMAAPAALGYGDTTAAVNDRIVGPLVATFAIVAIWEVLRGLRWVNLVFGIWLIVAPWILGYGRPDLILNDCVAGLLLGLLALVPGKTSQRYGGGWSSLWKS